MTKRKRLLGTTFYAIMLVSNLFLQEEKGNKGAGNSSIPAVSASHPKSSKHPFKLNGRLDNFQEKTKSTVRTYQDSENWKEHESLIHQVQDALTARDNDIQNLARTMYKQEGCYEETGDSFSKKRPTDRQGFLSQIRTYVGTFDYIINRKNSATDFYDNRATEQELEKIKEDKLSYREYHTSADSAARILASAYKNELCLGKEGKGLADMYLDIRHESNAGNCDLAMNLQRSIGDKRGFLSELRWCVPAGQASGYESEQKAKFYGSLVSMSDEDLALSAEFITNDEHDGWYNLCRSIRTTRGTNRQQADASCLADHILSERDSECSFTTEVPPSALSRLAGNLPHNDRLRICALQTTVMQMSGQQIYFDAREYFDKCLATY